MPTPEQTAKRMTYDPVFAIGENVRDMMAAHISYAIKDATNEAAAEIERLRAALEAVEDALGRILHLIDKAGLDNLANGVQLGPTSWYVKMSEAIEAAKALLPPDPNKD